MSIFDAQRRSKVVVTADYPVHHDVGMAQTCDLLVAVGNPAFGQIVL